jgi:ribosomal protein S18 acetylase RimI-like enzyme
VTDDPRLERALEFERRHNRLCATELLPFEWGHAYFSLDVPEIWDANHLRVEHPATVTASELAAEAEKLMAVRNLKHRRVFVDDDRLGSDLGPGFEKLDWEPGRWVVMVLSRPTDRRVGTEEVTEPGLELVRRGRDEAARRSDWYTGKGVLEQVRRRHFAQLETANGRDFAVVRDGLAVSFACLYTEGSTAQVEDVGTLDDYRGQGLSRAVVQRAVEAALQDGCDFVFLFADDGDWPKEFYARIGFETVGRIHHFLKKSA